MSAYPFGFTAGDDVLFGTDSLDLIGGWLGNDVINGLGGNDILFGLVGNDTLVGGVGNDLLIGGDGADSFVIGLGDGLDVAHDFNGAAGDRIDIAPGVTFTSQAAGLDWIIQLSDGSAIVLAGVAAVPADWIV